MPLAPDSPIRCEPLPGSSADVFRCELLRCTIRAGACIRRQARTDRQRTTQFSRGQGTDYPSCDSRKCPQGRAIRERLDPLRLLSWTGAGPGGRFNRDGAFQVAAHRRCERSGALDDVSTVDGLDPMAPPGA